MISFCYDSLVTVLVEASKTFHTKKCVNHIGRWSAELNALKVNSRVIARMWYLAGCPLHGELWENKKLVKRKYKNGLKMHKRGSKVQRMSTLKTVMHKCDAKAFWSTWNKNVTNNSSINSMHTAQGFLISFVKIL